LKDKIVSFEKIDYKPISAEANKIKLEPAKDDKKKTIPVLIEKSMSLDKEEERAKFFEQALKNAKQMADTYIESGERTGNLRNKMAGMRYCPEEMESSDVLDCKLLLEEERKVQVLECNDVIRTTSRIMS
jgi:hypothetical protein